ncbi:MAG: hypothetical protein OEU91_01690 [Gammaproteobacteria bacterium]|nr:hypothetical protein [Gammaproteobacteria bacterium]
MFLKPLSAVLMLLITISPLYAEDAAPADAVAADARPEAPASPIEQRIRAYRETFDRRQENLPANDKVLSRYQQEIQAQMEAHRQAYIKQREERRALAAKWREARKKYREAQMETWLKQAEDRQAHDISRHEALRNQAEERHNYLVKNHETLLENTLQQQIDFANRHEEMREQAEERRKQLAIFRANIKDMTPEERWVELEKYRTELFGETANPRRVVPPPRPPYAGPPVAE